MKVFFEKDAFTFDDIKSLIDSEAEESVYLEFKDAGALEKTEGKKKDIAKDVSAFANSDGGIIVYGIREENHKAVSITFINGNDFTKEWLEQVINTGVQRHIPGLQIFPIRNNGDVQQTVYVVKVPRSADAPHISKDNRYYKRNNFMAVPMEEYEVRDSYTRMVLSKLVIDKFYLTEIKIDPREIKFTINVIVFNVGEVFEPNYKTAVYFSEIPDRNFTCYLSNKCLLTQLDGRVKISTVTAPAIFPGEGLNAISFDVRIVSDNFFRGYKTPKTEVILFYGRKQDNMIVDLHELIFKFKGETIIAESANDKAS